MVDIKDDRARSTNPKSLVFAEQFGEFLFGSGCVTDDALPRATRAMRETGERFDVILTRLGMVSEAEMARLTAQYLGLPSFSTADLPLAPVQLDGIDSDYYRRSACLPLRDDGGSLLVATADPFSTEAHAALAFHLGRPVRLAVATAAQVISGIEHVYGPSTRPAHLGASLAAPSIEATAHEDDVRRLTDLASEAPVIRLVHDAIVRAVEAGASDLHLEDSEAGLTMRQRIDGLLDASQTIPTGMASAVISRIKIMAHMNIAERRLPQDGRLRVNVRGRDVELRVSTMPTLRGESVVLRILDRSAVSLDFMGLGFRGALLQNFLSLIDKPNGLILVTGPTGSGKSTTLYAALSRLNQPVRKTFTVEDPVETQMNGVSQVQVQPRIGLSFASALRSILRQDPDVIMVGEIRDLETAQMAIQAALTGHLVLATLHTNNAPATIARLVDMGVEDYLIASTLKGTLAQRLVRRLCPACARPAQPSPALQACLAAVGTPLNEASPNWRHFREATGCKNCRQTGYHGRLAIGELLVVDNTIAQSIIGSGGEMMVAAAARQSGMRPMIADGLEKVLAGETTLEEVLRVTQVS